MTRPLICIIALLVGAAAARSQTAWERLASRELRPVTFALSEVMLHDVANPPAASRFYAYAMAAGYETCALYDPGLKSLHGRANGFPQLGRPLAADSLCVPFAALWAMLETGRRIMPSGAMLTEKQAALEALFRQKKLPQHQINASKAAADAIAGQIAAWAAADGYARLTAFSRYRPDDGPGDWIPTPPDWMAAVEPRWSTLRPFLLDSVGQCPVAAPAPFDTARDSRFFALMQEVYDFGQHATPAQRETALYWDCNPFAVFHAGHMNIGLKKISPAGHWINIVGQVCEQRKTPFATALQVHAWTSLAMADAFLVCWHEKYRSNRIRPVTAINRLLDKRWSPLLQTPPFPEYVSGHSTVSTAAAEILTWLLGDGKPFTDATEVMYGLKTRRFASFRVAADEASLSRLYGGIHFRDALDNGQAQGRAVAALARRRLEK